VLDRWRRADNPPALESYCCTNEYYRASDAFADPNARANLHSATNLCATTNIHIATHIHPIPNSNANSANPDSFANTCADEHRNPNANIATMPGRIPDNSLESSASGRYSSSQGIPHDLVWNKQNLH
jgi:hypothetical protein